MNNSLCNINSIYIHIPFCVSKCNYCDFFSIPCKTKIISNEYVQSILQELEYKIQFYKINSIKTIYIGGGTPSLLSTQQINQIIQKILDLVTLQDDYEFTIEINPDDINYDYITFLNNSVINRISCGIQSLNDNVLKNVHRRANLEQNINCLDLLKKHWKKTLSVDLICGLPYENQKTFLLGLKKLIKYKPHHISMYSLTIEEKTPLGNQILTNKIDYDYEKADMLWLKAKKILEKKGYAQYEVSNFSLKNCECIHNLIYWNHQSFLGIGSGSSQTIYYKNGTAIRTNNLNNIEQYIAYWNKNTNQLYYTQENIDKQTSIFEFFMMGLRKNKGISQNDFINQFSQDIPNKVISLFNEWEHKKLAKIKKTKDDVNYSLTKKGLLFLNQFLQALY